MGKEDFYENDEVYKKILMIPPYLISDNLKDVVQKYIEKKIMQDFGAELCKDK